MWFSSHGACWEAFCDPGLMSVSLCLLFYLYSMLLLENWLDLTWLINPLIRNLFKGGDCGDFTHEDQLSHHREVKTSCGFIMSSVAVEELYIPSVVPVIVCLLSNPWLSSPYEEYEEMLKCPSQFRKASCFFSPVERPNNSFFCGMR